MAACHPVQEMDTTRFQRLSYEEIADILKRTVVHQESCSFETDNNHGIANNLHFSCRPLDLYGNKPLFAVTNEFQELGGFPPEFPPCNKTSSSGRGLTWQHQPGCYFTSNPSHRHVSPPNLSQTPSQKFHRHLHCLSSIRSPYSPHHAFKNLTKSPSPFVLISRPKQDPQPPKFLMTTAKTPRPIHTRQRDRNAGIQSKKKKQQPRFFEKHSKNSTAPALPPSAFTCNVVCPSGVDNCRIKASESLGGLRMHMDLHTHRNMRVFRV